MALAWLSVQWVIHTRHDIPRVDTIHIDSLVLCFAIGITLLSGIAAGALAAGDRGLGRARGTLGDGQRGGPRGHLRQPAGRLRGRCGDRSGSRGIGVVPGGHLGTAHRRHRIWGCGLGAQPCIGPDSWAAVLRPCAMLPTRRGPVV